MVYDTIAPERAYPTVLTDETLLAIRANEVMRLADGDAPFRDLWKRNIQDLSVRERKVVYDLLISKADKFSRLRANTRDLTRLVEATTSAQVRALDDVKWYEEHIERLKRGAKYLRKGFGIFQSKF